MTTYQSSGSKAGIHPCSNLCILSGHRWPFLSLPIGGPDFVCRWITWLLGHFGGDSVFFLQNCRSEECIWNFFLQFCTMSQINFTFQGADVLKKWCQLHSLDLGCPCCVSFSLTVLHSCNYPLLDKWRIVKYTWCCRLVRVRTTGHI